MFSYNYIQVHQPNIYCTCEKDRAQSDGGKRHLHGQAAEGETRAKMLSLGLAQTQCDLAQNLHPSLNPRVVGRGDTWQGFESL